MIKKNYKKAHERYQSFSKEETGKKRQNGRERYKICQKMKRKSWLSTEKKYYKMKKNTLL